MQTTTALSTVLEQFLASPDFEAGVIASTRASWAGNGYNLELFPDGSWRTEWTCSTGNRYDPPGVILGLPTLNDDGLNEATTAEPPMSEEDYLDLCFVSEEDELAQALRQSLKEAL